ncbi:peroxiredoxin [Thalassotalea profundi]|uniref:Glutathione-dependent peroxiredoxin n=2 Tax=Thalassotalea profundi TaxID=2036687 RepID=A0ABQ3IS52_9GAMM|nr:peroxiredoxin [Thalassotalea profundi]GHE89236.1 peroxiredoxin [Thalassotalea profundi]
MITENTKMPSGQLQQMVNGNMVTIETDEFFADKKVVLFAVPGAFTPTCSEAHLPGYIVLADQIKAKGVDAIVCLSVNDAFVMNAWGNSQNAENVMMMADGDGSYTKALGLEMETGTFGGLRSQRYSMIVDKGIVTRLNIEQPKQFEVSTAQVALEQL